MALSGTNSTSGFTTLLDDFCGSPLWDEKLLWDSDNPDLSPCFENTVLIWVPCIFLWLCAPLECYFQKKSIQKALPWTGANISRMVIALVLSILCCVDILDSLFNKYHEKYYLAVVALSSLKTLTFLFALTLMLFNRKKGRHTSGILFIFWFFLMLCEIFPYRSAFLALRNETSAPDEISFVTHMIYFPLLVAETSLCFVADIRYRHPLSKKDGRQECPERRASFPSKLLFWWFNGMSWLGWKRPLTMEDLYDLNPEDCTEYVARQFEKHYRHASWDHPKSTSSLKEETKQKKNEDASKSENGAEYIIRNGREEQSKKKINIIRSLAKTFAGYFMAGSVLKLIYDLLQFLNPMILKLLINYVESNDPIWIGVLYASCTLLNGTLQSMILGNYFHRMFLLGMRVRTALVTAIYKKSLVLSSSAKKESTVGEIVNLMSVDSQRFMDLMTYLNLIWSAPLQIIIALLMLFRVLGIAVLSGLLVSIILIPLNALLATHIKNKQVKQMKCKDERVKLVNEVLSGIKVLKLYAWEEAFKDKINKIREKEVKHLKGIAYLNSLSMMIWSCSPFLVSLVSFATFVLIDEKNQLDASTAFVSLSLFNILRFPLTMLPHLITTMVMVSVSVKRINKFMNSEELARYVTYDTSQSSAVCVRGGEFSWDRPVEGKEKKEAKSTLSNINLIVPKKSLIAIVGQVGSGKSSLFSAILGEMDRRQGSVSLNGKIAYVPQQPWIQNSTLQNNILFSKPLSKKEYDEILDSCSLKPDLEILPGGDQTEIGEKGINLSGGQKQRVSLARAVYSSADIYLLDDPLSAVDSHVGKHIFEKVIGPKGLLRSKTRVLITHSLTYLPQTDMIYVMKDGMIAEKGSFQELVDSKGPFADFLAQYGSEIEAEDLSDMPPELLRSLSQKSNTPDDESTHGSDFEDSKNMNVMSVNQLQRRRSTSLSLSHEKSASLKNNGVKLINIETAETGEVKFSVYSAYLKAIRYRWVAIIFSAYTIWQIFSVGSNVWLSEWGNDPPQNDTSDHSQRDMRLGVYGALGLAQALSVFVGSFSVAYGTLAAANILHNGLLTNVLKSPMSFFDTTPLGRVVNRFAKDVDTVDVTIPMTLRSWLSCLLQVVSTLLVISIQTPLFLIVVVPISIIYYFIQRFYLSTSRQLKRLESITKSPIYSHFSETLSGASTIRAYKAEERFCAQSNRFIDTNQICYYPSIIANRWLAIRLDFCGNIIILFSALFAVLQRDSLDAGKVGLSVTYALMVTATLNWMVRMSSELETNIVAVERILEYTFTPTEAEWIVKDKRPPPEWPQHGAVVMNNYSTRYRGNLDLVLKRICCDIKAGEKIGIVGRTGAGKSSLTLSLFRIIEAAEGSIIMDGETISEMGLHDLRSKITIIPQDPVLFSGTLRMNLDPFSWYSDSQLWEALEHAHLKSFVSSLDDGLEHEIIEGGENLSVGQRQLVCLARALLRKTKILVLDEATAAVDLETDSLIQVTIREEFRDASVLTIAHRLNTVMDYDRIMVLDQGEVAEFDPPNILLKDKKSIFYGMAKDAGLV